MARLYEYQGKELLKQFKIPVPAGRVASSAGEVRAIAEELGRSVVLKAQVWTTRRASMGGIQFADSPAEAHEKAKDLFGLVVKGFRVEKVLVEEKLAIKQEFYTGIIIDDTSKMPLILFSSVGGTGIEEIAKTHPDRLARMSIDSLTGLRDYQARNLVRRTGLHGKLQFQIGSVLVGLWQIARKYDARAAEINPLVMVKDGTVYAADCRLTIDDYAVYRHQELGIEVAREFDHPPTELEKIAYNIEKNDYRGTFYFIQLEQNFKKGDNYIGFHGAGGGGSMMSMDAVNKQGFKIANFTDTSGNPPASKVYRAAKIILSQKGIDGYFASGSGVASQEQFHSARGLVKAFREEQISIPAVIRLGGNEEDLAVEILTKYTRDLPAPVEGYKKDDSADYCAGRLRTLVDHYREPAVKPEPRKRPGAEKPYTFQTLTGRVTFDHAKCESCESKICIQACQPGILKLDGDVPVLAITRETAEKGKCIECLACELACEFEGGRAAYIDLPIPGLEAIRFLNPEA
ncbi:succinyl-CoA ligase [ADP-forming] subunit beta [bacterium BMS3Abin05]|nr:succinyl-CoA ligase [ADP-forming] subunit beta [bacterium BMS3Abin05]GBE27304.1 succinyl-CoA ligase [ADP-forming] subunit beta [bacterium BMS3Bbin03]HDZ11451.1 succinyl-CoA synthetase subunit beta [Bacteroidota bacterium]